MFERASQTNQYFAKKSRRNKAGQINSIFRPISKRPPRCWFTFYLFHDLLMSLRMILKIGKHLSLLHLKFSPLKHGVHRIRDRYWYGTVFDDDPNRLKKLFHCAFC